MLFKVYDISIQMNIILHLVGLLLLKNVSGTDFRAYNKCSFEQPQCWEMLFFLFQILFFKCFATVSVFDLKLLNKDEWPGRRYIIKGIRVAFSCNQLPCQQHVAKSLQSCPTLYDPLDSGPQGSPVPGILQARTLEWVAISFSNA